ncbi:hypothetical protein CC117_25460 [Parafrankia colletiae]|uniref:Uncharacterized protein n=1 Tax=Parafrankia colletiae TaxID=573497 RepID=A0A1S1QA11_9ACTN|nr:hypothetical protein CC117_25460 [Parafrankia colletiae]
MVELGILIPLVDSPNILAGQRVALASAGPADVEYPHIPGQPDRQRKRTTVNRIHKTHQS